MTLEVWIVVSFLPGLLSFSSLLSMCIFLAFCSLFLFSSFLFFKLFQLFQTQSLGLLWTPLSLWSRFSFNGADRKWGSLRSSAGCRVEEELKIGPFPEHPLWQKQNMLLCSRNGCLLSWTYQKTYFSYLSLVRVQMLEAVGRTCGLSPGKRGKKNVEEVILYLRVSWGTLTTFFCPMRSTTFSP